MAWDDPQTPSPITEEACRAIEQTIITLMRQATLETAISPKPEYYELAMRPEDYVVYDKWYWSTYRNYMLNVGLITTLTGITVVEDITVPIGRPVLRCTWSTEL